MVTTVHIRRLPVLAARAREAIDQLELTRPDDLPGNATFDVRPDGCACVVIHTTVMPSGPVATARWYAVERRRHRRWVAAALARIESECGGADRYRGPVASAA